MKNQYTKRPRPMALIILDGWGYRENTQDNAIAAANTPCWDALWQTAPHTLLEGSGEAVGLPDGQMGNSEVGHLTIGAGRTVYQDLTRIHLAIQDQSFFQNAILSDAIAHAVQQDKAIHLIGLLSAGGVHSHEKHFIATLALAARHQAKKVFIHAFLDGRDTPPQSAAHSLMAITDACETHQCGQIVSLIGRYYAMDRDNRWDRIQQAYDLLVTGKAVRIATDPLSGLHAAYAAGETDEFVKATAICQTGQKSPVTIQSGDTVICLNFRADRAREITRALKDPTFSGFDRPHFPDIHLVTLTEYDAAFPLPVAFPPDRPKHNLGKLLAEHQLRQLRIAETEKYAHVTFFFNGGVETPNPLEDRILIPSPNVATYDLQPEMSAPELTDRFVAAIESEKYDVIICNFANPDMVGHTGNLAATIKAIETVDTCLARILTALKKVGGEVLITADHGNAEMLKDSETGQPHTAHTDELVPLIYVGRPAVPRQTNGTLSDITPTLLYLMHLPLSAEMTGQPLFHLV